MTTPRKDKVENGITTHYMTEEEMTAWNLANDLPADFRFKLLPKRFNVTCRTCGHVHECGYPEENRGK